MAATDTNPVIYRLEDDAVGIETSENQVVETSSPIPLLEPKMLKEFEIQRLDKEFNGSFYQVATPTRILGRPLKLSSLISPGRVGLSHMSIDGGSTLTLPYGLQLIYAPTKGGKSTFSRALVERTDPNGSGRFFERLLVVEPFDSEEEREEVKCFQSVDDALVYATMRIYETGGRCIPILDSLRAPLFETTGAAGDKGVINRFFINLTRLSNALAMNNLTMFATLNPMSDDESQRARIEYYLNAGAGSIFTLMGATDGTFSGNYVSRDKGNNRAPRNWTMTKKVSKGREKAEKKITTQVVEAELNNTDRAFAGNI